jgi:hypothetical protein
VATVTDPDNLPRHLQDYHDARRSLPKFLRDADAETNRSRFRRNPPPPPTQDTTAWAKKALEAELAALAAQTQPGRNDQLNRSAFNLFQIVGGGHLDYDDTWQALHDTACGTGLPPGEVTNTLRSASRAGLASPRHPAQDGVDEPRPPVREPRTLTETRAAFTRWLGTDYDLTVLDVVLAVAASEQLGGDPAWLLVVSGPGAAKTETVVALAGAGATVTSTITSDGALLSGSPRRDRGKHATGGLLRKLGTRGVLVIKDVTSILSMNRDARGGVLAALREVYDGMWERNLGVDGGQSLRWQGRLVVIGAVTTSWDKAHGVVSAMGDRFLIVRLDSTTKRVGAGRQAIRNTGEETTMRADLAAAVGGLLTTIDPTANQHLAEEEVEQVLALANVVTLARTAVERDYRGDVIDAHAPEMPTRFAKQLAQVMRGAMALSMDRRYALTLARRCAADSVPPLRLAVLLDLLDHPNSTTHAVRKRLDRPRATVDRELQALHMIGLLTVEEVETVNAKGYQTSVWYYSMAAQTDARTVRLLGSARNVGTREEPSLLHSQTPCSDISGTTSPAPDVAALPRHLQDADTNHEDPT